MDAKESSCFHNFEVGNRVIDQSAIENGWPDTHGKIIKVDGTNIKVKYDSGNERWKRSVNLQRCSIGLKFPDVASTYTSEKTEEQLAYIAFKLSRISRSYRAISRFWLQQACKHMDAHIKQANEESGK